MTVGSLLGLTVAYFAYRQYYPSLADELSHRPYSPRLRDENPDSILPVHNQSRNQRYDSVGHHDLLELDGTVQRPGPQHLRDAFRDHDESGVGNRGPYRDPFEGDANR